MKTCRIGLNLAKKTKDYICAYNKCKGTNYKSVLQINPQSMPNLGKAFSMTHINPCWSIFQKAPTSSYASNSHVYIDKLISTGKGAGTREIKRIVRQSLENPETQGRVVLSAELIDPERGHPVGFYYKLGFRACIDKVNSVCKEWLEKGGITEFAPGHFFNGREIPIGTTKIPVKMYLPEENIQHCLNYQEKGLRLMV